MLAKINMLTKDKHVVLQSKHAGDRVVSDQPTVDHLETDVVVLA